MEWKEIVRTCRDPFDTKKVSSLSAEFWFNGLHPRKKNESIFKKLAHCPSRLQRSLVRVKYVKGSEAPIVNALSRVTPQPCTKADQPNPINVHHITRTLPASPISYLYARKLIASSTVKSYLSAISAQIERFTPSYTGIFISKLLTALSRQGSCYIRLPISGPLLHELVDSLGHTPSSAFQRTLYSAMFLLVFYGFLGSVS